MGETEKVDEWVELGVLAQSGFGENVDDFSAREQEGAGQIQVVTTIVLLKKRQNGLRVQLRN